jgi:hypothetical protein
MSNSCCVFGIFVVSSVKFVMCCNFGVSSVEFVINRIINTYTKADQGPGRTQLLLSLFVLFLFLLFIVLLLLFVLLALLLLFIMILMIFELLILILKKQRLFVVCWCFCYYATFLRLRRECHIQNLLNQIVNCTNSYQHRTQFDLLRASSKF